MRPKSLLFFSSYAPLWGLLAIRSFGINSLAFAVYLAFAGFGVGALILIIRQHESVQANHSKIEGARDAGPEASSYLASYLLPFLTAPDPGIREAIMYVAFFVIAFAVHCRSSVIQINPLLYLMGWRVLRIETVRGFRGYLVTKYGVQQGQCLGMAYLSNDVLIAYQRPSDCE